MRHRVSLLALTMLLIASSFLSLSAQNGPQLLPADKLAKLLPATVFLDAENVPTQGRNASGVYLDGKLAIISLIDTTGYSSAYQEKYSGVILTQGKLTIGSETLAPGTYGFGQKKSGDHDNAMVTLYVYDVGGNELAQVKTERQADMRGMKPAQILVRDGAAHLYVGPYHVALSAAK